MWGADGDEYIEVHSIGNDTWVYGDACVDILETGTDAWVEADDYEDVVWVIIDGYPTDMFMQLFVYVEKLVIDNSANTSIAVAWTHEDGQLLSANQIPGAPSHHVDVIYTEGADLTRILGGTKDDTLHVLSNSSSDACSQPRPTSRQAPMFG